MSRISDAVERLKSGRFVILVDDEDRENEGDLVIAGEFATSERINFMAVQARGLICLALDAEIVDRLALPPMSSINRTARRTAFTVSIEATEGVSTGISAFDRARTIQAAVAPGAKREDVVSPGHVFPLRAEPGGVLSRRGHTEGSVDLMRIAGLRPAAVICEIMKSDGEMARLDDLVGFGRLHDIPLVTVGEIETWRLAHETLVETVAEARLPALYAPEGLVAKAFVSCVDGREYLALIKGPLREDALVRVHSECLTGDVLGSLRCDCGAQLQASLAQISECASSVLIYLQGQEGRGIGLVNKIRAYALQDTGLDTVEANAALGFADDLRNYAVAAQILKSLGVLRVRLLSNNPRKAADLERFGIIVEEELPLVLPANSHNLDYLRAKRDKLGHRLPASGKATRSAA